MNPSELARLKTVNCKYMVMDGYNALIIVAAIITLQLCLSTMGPRFCSFVRIENSEKHWLTCSRSSKQTPTLAFHVKAISRCFR